MIKLVKNGQISFEVQGSSKSAGYKQGSSFYISLPLIFTENF